MTATRNRQSRAKAKSSVRLAGKVDLAASERLTAELKAARGADLSIDASGVELIGAHAVQSLLVARHSWKSDGKTLTVTGWPDAAVDQLRCLGLAPESLCTEEVLA